MLVGELFKKFGLFNTGVCNTCCKPEHLTLCTLPTHDVFIFRKIPKTKICYLATEYKPITIKMEKESLVSVLKYLLTYMKFVIQKISEIPGFSFS
jgi:hypothetical protein